MELGNQFGINMGNILTTSSALKTAKLKQDKAKREEDRDLAGIKLRKNALTKEHNLGVDDDLSSANDSVDAKYKNILGGDIGVSSDGSEEMKDFWTKDSKEQNAVEAEDREIDTLSDEELITANALAPKVAKELKDTAQKEADIANMTKFFKSSGLSDNEAQLRARGYSERIDKFSKSMREAKDYEKKEMREVSAQQSKYWYNMMETFKENPELANRQYKQKRVETIETIAELNKSDNPLAKKEAQRLQEIYDAQPPEFSMDFAGVSMAEANQKLTTADDIIKEQVATTKSTRDIEAERIKNQRTRYNKEHKPFVTTEGGFDYTNTWNEKQNKYIRGKGVRSNALLKQESANKGKSGTGNQAKTSQYQKDFTSREKQINSIMSGANIMNTSDKDKAIKEANIQLKVALEAFKRGDPNGYKIQFGEKDPLNEMSIRKKEVQKDSADVFPDGYHQLDSASKEKWKDTYITTGKSLPLKVKKGGVFSDDKVSLKNSMNKDTKKSNLPKNGTVFRDKSNNKVYKMINGEKVEMRKKG